MSIDTHSKINTKQTQEGHTLGQRWGEQEEGSVQDRKDHTVCKKRLTVESAGESSGPRPQPHLQNETVGSDQDFPVVFCGGTSGAQPGRWGKGKKLILCCPLLT